MKTKSTLLLALTAVTAMTFAPQTALAGHREDKVAIAIGGIIGGVLIGKHLERNREPRVVQHCEPAPRVVVVQRAPACPPPPPSGYWQETRTQVWVPSQWIESCDNYGRRTRTWQQGHYEWQTTRVWVDTSSTVSYTYR